MPIEESRLDEFKQEWSAVTDKIRWGPKTYVFGAFVKEELIGYIKFTINGGVGHLTDLIVKKKVRGKKYGYELLKYFIDFCTKNKCHKLTIKTSEEHKKAIKLYESLGFAREAEYKDDKFHVTWYTYSARNL